MEYFPTHITHLGYIHVLWHPGKETMVMIFKEKTYAMLDSALYKVATIKESFSIYY